MIHVNAQSHSQRRSGTAFLDIVRDKTDAARPEPERIRVAEERAHQEAIQREAGPLAERMVTDIKKAIEVAAEQGKNQIHFQTAHGVDFHSSWYYESAQVSLLKNAEQLACQKLIAEGFKAETVSMADVEMWSTFIKVSW